jgi:hypothetical protein
MNALLLAIALLNVETTLPPGAAHRYEVSLKRGQSADVVVQQKGVDVVVELRAPNGALLDEVDGPTGRNGDERFEIFAKDAGRYAVTVRPFDAKEPAGTYRIEVKEIRGVAATRALLDARRDARNRAGAWLRERADVEWPAGPPCRGPRARPRAPPARCPPPRRASGPPHRRLR